MAKNKYKPSLSARVAYMISDAAKTTGNFNDVGQFEESLYADEVDSVFAFCEWLQVNQHRASYPDMCFTAAGYPRLYKEYFLKGK